MDGDNIMNKVPNIITNKDLDYLKDIFNWNYILYKTNINELDYIEDEEIIKFINECNNLFFNNMNLILNILDSGDNNE